MESSRFNLRNPAVKRIMQEIKEIQQESSLDLIADALEDDIFEWHFVIRGPPDTEFEGGIYHGRILLPAEYPFKPPSFMMLTPNGRFQTGVKICLSISSHHPEHWQPSWSVRTALMALIAFMPTPGAGALGSVDFTKEERQQLAAKSRLEPPRFGSAARQKVIDDMHQRMVQLQQQRAGSSSGTAARADAAGTEQVAPAAAPAAAPMARQLSDDTGNKQPEQQQQQQEAATAAVTAAVAGKTAAEVLRSDHLRQQHVDQRAQPVPHDSQRQVAQQQQQQQQHAETPSTPAPPPAVPHLAAPPYVAHGGGSQPAGPAETPADKGLTFLATVLVVAIVALLFKKVALAWGWQLTGIMES